MKTTVYVVNKDDAPLRLILEPWGNEDDLDPGVGQWFELDGPDAGLIEVRSRLGEMTVYGWVGSSVNDGINPQGPRVPHTPWSKPTG